MYRHLTKGKEPSDRECGRTARQIQKRRARIRVRRSGLADLKGATLCKVKLRGTDLRGADLTGADLRKANLKWANVREANLAGADLNDANLMLANLVGANLRGTNLDDALMPDGTRHWYWQEHHAEMSDVDALQAGLDLRCSECGRLVRPDDPAWLPSKGGGVQCGACVTGSDMASGVAAPDPSGNEVTADA